MEQLILIETRIGRAYSYYTGEKLQHTFYTSEEGKALFENTMQKYCKKGKKKRAEIEMMEGENEGEDIESGSDDDDDESKDVDVGDIEMVETKK